MTYEIQEGRERQQVIYRVFRNGVYTGEWFFEERDAKAHIKVRKQADLL
jgi:hypothetical protein